MRPLFRLIASLLCVLSLRSGMASEPPDPSDSSPAVQGSDTDPGATPRRAPLEVTLDDAALKALDPKRQAVIRALADTMEEQLSYWAAYPILLPPSAFAGTGQLIPLSSLFQAPTDDELDSVARGPDGKLKKLTPAQLRQVRQEALFVVPSERYPGQSHVWKLTVLLQKGRKDVRITWQQSNARALRHLIVKIPDRLAGRDPVSVRKGFANIGYGLRDTLGLLIGLVEEKPRYSAGQVKGMVDLERKKYVSRPLEPLASDPLPEQWVAPDGVRIDLRLYNGDLMSQAVPRLRQLFAEVVAGWQLEAVAFRDQTSDRLRKEGVPDAEIPQRIADAAVETQQDRFYRRVLEDRELERLSPGLGRLMVNFGMAIAVVRDAERMAADAAAHHQAKVQADLLSAHPTRARIPEWLEERVQAAMLEYYAAHQWDAFDQARKALHDAGLKQEAWVLETDVRFMKEEAERLAEALSAERVAARTFEWERRRWSRKRWTVEPEKRVIDVTPDGEPVEQTFYTLNRYATTRISTDIPFWRVGNFWLRSVTWFNNSLHRLVKDNALNGPLGLKSLFLGQPFYADWTVDERTGQLLRDPGSLTPTMASRVRALWQDVRESRQAFESKPDTGFIGKSFTRVLNKGWNYVLKGGFGTFLVVVGQPGLTVLNLGGTTALTLAAPVWAPASSAVVTGFNVGIYDTESPRQPRDVRPFPLIAHTVGRAGFGGVGQVALGAVAAGVYEPTAALVGGTFGGARALTRTFYDGLLYGLVIKRLGRIPARDGFLARRIEGPGLSSSFYFQIRPEIALLAVQAHLEQLELELYERRTRDALQQPVEEYNRFMAEVLGPFTSPGVPGGVYEQVSRSTANHVQRLDFGIGLRRRELNQVMEIPHREHIRMNRDDLELTLTRATPIVRRFHERRIFPRFDDGQRTRFWAERSLSPGDWQSLTAKMLAGAFAPGLLEPLEDADRSLRLVVEHVQLRSYIDAIERGDGPGDDLQRVRLTRVGDDREVRPRRPLIGPDDLFHRGASGLADGLEALGHGHSLDDLREAKGLEPHHKRKN